MPSVESARRVLIVSSHPLFSEGLRSLLEGRSAAPSRRQSALNIVDVVANTDEAATALEERTPAIVIVDYDDHAVNREEFLARFVEGEKPMRVVLVSLKSECRLGCFQTPILLGVVPACKWRSANISACLTGS